MHSLTTAVTAVRFSHLVSFGIAGIYLSCLKEPLSNEMAQVFAAHFAGSRKSSTKRLYKRVRILKWSMNSEHHGKH